MIWALIPNWLKYSLATLVAAFLLLAAGYVARKRDGRSSIEAKIERQNNEATDKALGAVLDYDQCIDAGGVWTFRTGKCERRP
ncbi:hypothetical protein CEV34_2500 [Brucella pseudogrignonensis]|uniref:Uncharacterized protein n=1 Tax=Brucella pseudogrignonensis TaxID=419475 RepID=A0A256GGF3_9HYPH|nr:hypothetical protein [Brucella pseudogrignonensis]OYR26202.1 hypothetical protein CEV34_2500 [Brucella pseudogrignonensis]